MPLILNPARGELLFTEDPSAYYQMGYRDPTDSELDAWEAREKYGSFEQQAQAQGERVLRGATFGAVEGFGAPEDIRGRAEVSQELSPVTSFAASVLPDVGVAALTGGLGGLATGAGRAAGRAAIAEGAGIVRAGLAAARAGGATALAAESLGSGAVAAGQTAYAEGREFEDDPGRWAEDVLLWGGLNFGLGAPGLRTRGAARAAAELPAEAAERELDDIAAAAEMRAAADVATDAAEAAPARAPTRAPLDDVELPGADGMLERAAPDDPRLAAIQPELDRLRAEGIAGKSLDDLRARQPTKDDTAAKLAAFETDPTFLATGKLPTEIDNTRGGLPALSLFPGEPPALGNGIHRFLAARKAGLEEIVANVKKYDAEGNTIWDYVGPVRIKEAPIPAGAVRQGEREAVEAGVERALRNASKSDADDIVEQATRAAEPVKEADSFGRQRRLYINRGPILEVAAREMQQDLTQVVQDVEKVSRLDKVASIAAHVSDNLSAQQSAARVISEDAAKFAGELRAEAKAYGASSGKKGLQYAIPGQKSWTAALMDHAKQVEKASTGPALFEAVDGFKRAAQDFKLSLESGAINSVNPIHHQKLIPRIDSFAQKIRTTLEDAGTWGRAGDMQRAYNAVIHDQLLPSMRVFEDAVLKKTHKGYDGLWNTEGWETKIAALLKGENAGNRRHVSAVLDAMDQLASVRRTYGDAATATRIEDKTAKIRRTMGLADEVSDATERMTALGELVGGVPYGGAIAGGLAGGFPGAAIGAALPGAVRGFVLGDLVSAYQRLSGATDVALQRGVDDWIRSSRLKGAGLRMPKMLQLSDEAKQLRDVAARRGISQSMALFQGDDGSPHAAFERMRDALLDEEKFFELLGHDYDALAREDPDVFMMLSGRAGIARQFLIARMPPNVAVSMANPNGYPPSREAVEDWAQYVNAVRYPTRVLRNIGAISQPEIETLRTVYPRLFERTQQRVIEAIGKAQTTGEPLEDSFLVRAGLLFPDVDGMGSPVFSREYGEAVRAFTMQQQQQQMKRGGGELRPPKAAPLNATIQGGATFGQGF